MPLGERLKVKLLGGTQKHLPDILSKRPGDGKVDGGEWHACQMGLNWMPPVSCWACDACSFRPHGPSDVQCPMLSSVCKDAGSEELVGRCGGKKG